MSTEVVDAVERVLPSGAGWVEVLGEGAVARHLRDRFEARRGGGEGPPLAVVDTTGEAQAIEQAMARVADLGTVVLAGPPPAEPVALDLYPDLHVRGLMVVGLGAGGG